MYGTGTVVPNTLNTAEDHEVLASRAMSKVLRYNSEGAMWYISDSLVSILRVKRSEQTQQKKVRTMFHHQRDSYRTFRGGLRES